LVSDPRWTGEEAGAQLSSPEDWLDAVHGLERRGELLTAVDLASRGLERFPDDVRLKHRAVLSLARAGSTAEALHRFFEYGLGDEADEEVAALKARLDKDVALAAGPEDRRRLASWAAGSYTAIYDRTGSYYPAVNAATLSLMAGEREQAQELARLAIVAAKDSVDPSYFELASIAEALLVLGDEAEACDALARAISMPDADYGSRATTRRQIRTICRLTGAGESAVRELAGPAVAHYCGHRIESGDPEVAFTAGREAEIAERIKRELTMRPVAVAYGSLASGADILWAEEMMQSGCELNVVLPYGLEEFVANAVAPAGDSWVGRFNRCLASAETVRFATAEGYLGDDVLYRYGSELAMGLALLRARYLDADVRQLAVWDGGPPRGEAGTAVDVARWESTGHEAVVLRVPPGSPDAAPLSTVAGGGKRVMRTMLFADFRGFSKLDDEQIPRFAAIMLGALAKVLDRYEEAFDYRSTWGDATFVVLKEPAVAARCALELRDAMAAIDPAANGLPPYLGLRICGHLGPVLPIDDPIRKTRTFMGSHVSRTARLEPVTPPGVVYVTEPYAASLALSSAAVLECDYVGHLPAARDLGPLRMYRLRRSVDVEGSPTPQFRTGGTSGNARL
jgi:class 3 adenylate cyclase